MFSFRKIDKAYTTLRLEQNYKLGIAGTKHITLDNFEFYFIYFQHY